jgi:RNA polymerase sigma-70 factor (ECF subfamily)
MKSADVTALIRAARAGDQDALNRLLGAYRHYLLVLADAGIGRGLRAKADPSDLAQEALLLACQNFARFRGTTEAELVAWLRRILARCLAQLGRRYLAAAARDLERERGLEDALRDSTAALARLVQTREDSPSGNAIQVERAVILAGLLSELPEDYRRVIVHRDLEQLSWEDVGARMGRSPDAARMLWARALRQFGPMVQGKGL